MLSCLRALRERLRVWVARRGFSVEERELVKQGVFDGRPGAICLKAHDLLHEVVHGLTLREQTWLAARVLGFGRCFI